MLSCRSVLLAAVAFVSLTFDIAARAEGWVTPTAEELRMAAPVEDPGANAVYLSYDEVDNDRMNDHAITVRLKVLTQAGVERYSDVQVGTTGRHFSIVNVEARTVHADGTVVPFTGKPFVKTVRHLGETYKATVFSMPDVQVGSILEYRYHLAYDDNMVLPARWFLQHDAYALHEQYVFRPLDTSGSRYVMLDHGQTSQGLFYVSVLPKGAAMVPPNAGGHAFYELTVSDVPALPDEDALPPINSYSERVLFYYAAQINSADYWKSEGKFLSKDMNSFATAGPRIRADVATLAAPGDAPEVKARKLYDATMKIENTEFTREHTRQEDMAQGLRPVKTAEDVWVRQRGTSDEIALTYLALLREAGIHAYAMRVTDRDKNLFEPAYIDTSQLDDVIVIASLNGKEVYLDPGARFCPYGQLAWAHSWATGVRQVDGGTSIAQAGPLAYKDTILTRTAELGLSDDGMASGTVTLSYSGQAAMLMRQRETGEAAADTKQRFEEELRPMLPGGMNLHVISIANLENSEKPLEIVYGVSGPIGTVSGHRLLVQEALLRNDERERFTEPTRKYPVYFHYPYQATDVVVLKLAPGLKLEAAPNDQASAALDIMAYKVSVRSSGDTLRLVRSVAVNAVILPATDYPKLREFFGGLRSADTSQLLFTREPQAAVSGTEAASAPGK